MRQVPGRPAWRPCSLLSPVLAVLAAIHAAPPVAGDPSSDWWTAARREAERSEYHFSWQGRRLQAPNRAHGLRTFVTPEGLELTSRTEGADGFIFMLRLRGFGRESDVFPVGPGVISSGEARAELRRRGLTEWMINDLDGLKHGLTLHSPPATGAGAVVLSFELGGNLLAYPMDPDGHGIVLRTAEGRRALRYHGLAVFDALGRSLPARMEIRPGELRFRIDDAGAVYPLEVDPIADSPAWVETGSEGAGFGASVATAGDVNGDGFSDVVVGAPNYDGGLSGEGAVFVYHGGPSGPASTPAFRAESDQFKAHLGHSVSTAGDVNNDGFDDVIVGAPDYDNGQTDEGIALAFYGSATGLDLGGSRPVGTPANADWMAESDAASALYGTSVAFAGDVNGDGIHDVVVGAPKIDTAATDGGEIFVYYGAPSGLSPTADWSQTSAHAGANLGHSVSAGDFNGDGFADIVAGAPLYNLPEVDEGRIFVYHGSASGPSFSGAFDSDQAGAQFGWSVSTAGDANGDGYADVVVGSPYWDRAPDEVDYGMVRILYGSSSGITETGAQTLDSTVDWPSACCQFGKSVATAGDVNGDGFADIAVGTPNRGRAHVLVGSQDGIVEELSGYWSGSGEQSGDRFGASVATAGDVDGDGFSDLIVGADGYDFFPGVNHGRAYVYHGGPDGPEGVVIRDVTFSEDFGASTSYADVNGDGFSDILVGEPLFDGGQVDEGRVLVYLGGPDGPAVSPQAKIESNVAGAEFGRSVSGTDDVNGDGFDDMIVGAPGHTGGSGAIYVYLGSSAGVQTTAWWTQVGGTANEQLGRSVSGAGDVNRDGLADVIAGSPGWNDAQDGIGAAWVYLGSTSTMKLDRRLTVASQFVFSFGQSVDGAGDVNGDGFSDVIVGAPGENAGSAHAYVFLGSSSGTLADPSWDTSGSSQLGSSVAGAGDVNGDGYDDIVIGQPGWDNFDGGTPDEGRFLVYQGDPDMQLGFLAERQGNASGARLGAAVGGAGDVNGDGYADLITGAPGGDPPTSRTTLWYGSPSGIPDTQSWSESVGGGEDGSVGPAGDVNGDGFDDFLIGTPNLTNGGVRVYFGGGGDGMDRIPRSQQPSSTSAPRIALHGKSSTTDSVRLRTRARTAAGRDRVQVEYEVKPLHIPFDGQDTTFSNLLLTSSPSSDGSRINFSSRITGLTEGPHYHWRLRHRSTNPLFPGSPWMTYANRTPVQSAFITSCAVKAWYRDADGDTWGTDTETLDRCTQPAGYVSQSGDCDDTDPNVNPGQQEIQCDAVDNDCATGTPDAPDVDADAYDVCETTDPGDTDGLPADCNDGNADVWQLPGETQNLMLSDDDITTSLSWIAPTDPGAGPGAWAYDVLRSGAPSAFDDPGQTICLATDLASESASDAETPAPGSVFHYLVRTGNACGEGTLGTESGGLERNGLACP